MKSKEFVSNHSGKLIFIIIAILCLFIVVRIAIIAKEQQEEILNDVKISAENVAFDSKWLNVTFYFDKLPEEGLTIELITVENLASRRNMDIKVFQGESFTVTMEHDGKLFKIPEYCIIWGQELGFKVYLAKTIS